MTEHPENLTHIGLDQARSRILGADTIVLTTHVNPDGDALGSEGALYLFLRQRGKTVRIINTSGVPAYLEILETGGMFEEYDPAEHDAFIAAAELVIVLDVNTSSRLLRMEQAVLGSGAEKLVIDHHTDPKPFADLYCVDTEVSATGHLVYDLIDGAENGKIDKDIALQLYVAIVTDTGQFQFERTTPRVHEIAAHLLSTGLYPPAIHGKVYHGFEFGRTKLLGMVLGGMQSVCNGRATILLLTRRMMDETNTRYEETEGFVNFGLSINGVRATALVAELPDEIKISFRSRDGIEIHRVAQKFGGGGHIYAAGARIVGEDLQSVRDSVERELCMLFQ